MWIPIVNNDYQSDERKDSDNRCGNDKKNPDHDEEYRIIVHRSVEQRS